MIAGASELPGRTDIFFSKTTIRAPNLENTLENVMATMSRAGYHAIDITDLNRSPRHGVLSLCEVAFVRKGSSLLAGIDLYE